MTIKNLQSAAAEAGQHGLTTDALLPSGVLRFVKPAPLVLTSMVLPQAEIERMRAVLDALGFAVEDASTEDGVGADVTTFRYTLIRNGTHARVLLYIGDEVLTVANRHNKRALVEIREIFATKNKVTALYVFHGLNPSPAFKNLMQGEWRDVYRIRVRFIPLSDLAAFDEMSDADRAAYLRRELELDEGPGESVPAKTISGEDIRKIIRIIAAIPAFKDDGVRGRRVLVQTAGLSAVAGSFDFDGNPQTVAGRRLLLEGIVDRDDLPTDACDFLKDVLKREDA